MTNHQNDNKRKPPPWAYAVAAVIGVGVVALFITVVRLIWQFGSFLGGL